MIMPTTGKVRKRVLVVDDDRALNYVLVEMLAASGYDANGEGDGLAAIRRIEREQFDLVLLDIGLPKMSGLEVLKLIRERRLSPRVIVMTADDTPDTILSVVKDQAYQYIAKPTAPKAIRQLAAISQVARRPEVDAGITSPLHGIENGDGIRHMRIHADRDLEGAERDRGTGDGDRCGQRRGSV